MDFNTALGIIRKDLEEARALLDGLSMVQGKHIAEMELARSRIRSATELLTVIPQLQADNAEPKVTEESVAEVRVKDEDIIIPQPQSQPESQSQSAPQSQPESQSQPEPQPEPPAKAREKSAGILADKFSSTDRIGGMTTSVKQDEMITSVMQNKPVSDIGAAIGINDKFYYIRELFSGDSRAYHDTISRLNSSASLGEAMKILDESTVMGSDPAAQSAFVDVVRRKFNFYV